MDKFDSVRQHVISLLRGGQAFDSFREIVADFPYSLRGKVPPKAEHSAWQILEHMRLALRDVLEFSTNSDGTYKEKKWPEDYWPKTTLGDWDSTLQDIYDAQMELEKLVESEDLFKPFPWGDGQTLLREALLAAEHAAYHLGQLVLLRKLF